MGNMDNMVRPEEIEQFGKDGGLVHEAVVTGRKCGAGPEFWSGLAHNKAWFLRVVGFAAKHGYYDLIGGGGMFMAPKVQLALTMWRNEERGWGFTEADFEALGTPPVWPDGRLCAVVLDVSLDTVSRTFEEGWHFTKSVQPGEWRWPEVKSDEAHLKLLDGIAHQRGLLWRVVDLAANWDKKDGIAPVTVRSPKSSPSSAVLWAASYFPELVRAMDGVKVPYWWLAGYQLSVSGFRPWSCVPYLHWDRVSHLVRLGAYGASRCDGGRAVPAMEC